MFHTLSRPEFCQSFKALRTEGKELHLTLMDVKEISLSTTRLITALRHPAPFDVVRPAFLGAVGVYRPSPQSAFSFLPLQFSKF